MKYFFFIVIVVCYSMSEPLKKKTKAFVHKKRYKHPNIFWNRKKAFQCFVYRYKGLKDQKLIGAYRLIKSWYFPNFHFCKSKKGKGAKGGIHRSLDRAKKLGSRVDREMTYWTKYKKMCRKPHRYSRQLYNIFEQMKWKPIAAQQAVGLPEHKVATAFDLLMEDSKKNLILVDVKTGYESHWDASDGQKLESPPLQDLPSSCETHSWLQLALTAILFTANNLQYCESHPLKKLHIVRTARDGVRIYGMPPYLERVLDDLKKKLLKRR
jgi:hypothetical protein